MRRLSFAAALSATALLLGGSVVSAAPAGAAACPTVLPDGTVELNGATSWSGCDLDGAHLEGWQLTSAVITDLRKASFKGAHLQGAVLRGQLLDGATFQGADLTGADLTGATAWGLTLQQAVLDGAQLSRAAFYKADLTGAYLGKAHLVGAAVSQSTGAPASLPTSWVMTSGVLAGPEASLAGTTLQAFTPTGASLRQADLRGAVIVGGSLAGVDVTGADFRTATLTGTSLVGVVGYAAALWSGAKETAVVCPDGKKVEAHNSLNCAAGVDVTPPVIAPVGLDAFIINGQRTWPLTVTETGSGYAATRTATRWAPSGTSRWSSWDVSDWYNGSGYSGAPSKSMSASTYSFGVRVCVKAQVRDRAGLLSTWSAPRCIETPYNQTDVLPSAYAFPIVTVNNSSWVGIDYAWSRDHGAFMEGGPSYTVHRVGLLATTCPTCGSVVMYVGSTKVASLSLVRTTTRLQTIVLGPLLPAKVSGRLRLRVTSPTGRLVRVDAVVVSAA